MGSHMDLQTALFFSHRALLAQLWTGTSKLGRQSGLALWGCRKTRTCQPRPCVASTLASPIRVVRILRETLLQQPPFLLEEFVKAPPRATSHRTSPCVEESRKWLFLATAAE